MTYVHFFEDISIESVCACVAFPPKKLIVIGSNGNAIRRYARSVSAMLHRRGHLVDTEVRTVPINDLSAVYDLLCKVMESEGNCSVCLNGGDELALVATGMLYEKYGTRPKLHRFNLTRGSILDLHKDGRQEVFEAPVISVEEMISLFGGKVVYCNEKPDGTRIWDMNPSFVSDIERAWQICKANTKSWNNFASALGVLLDNRSERGGVVCSMSVADYEDAMLRDNGKVYYSPILMNKLYKAGLITQFSDRGVFSVTFKNEQVMHLLTVAGRALEMKIYLAAKNARSDGKKTYDDVVNGVFVDWDGIVNSAGGTVHTENEIDVMMTRGGIPVFISCKNGFFDANELYKLNSVAEQFGGEYAKKAIVASSLSSLGKGAAYIRERAEDMGIVLIDDVKTMTDAQLERRLSTIWLS